MARHHQTHNTPPLSDLTNPNHAPKTVTPPAQPVISTKRTKPPTTPHHKTPIIPSTEPISPSFTKPSRHYPIISHQERQKIISAARRRDTRREKLHHATSQHPLSDYWPDITPQSLPIALHPPTHTPSHTSHNIHNIGRKTAPPTNTTPPAKPPPSDNIECPRMGQFT